MASGMRENDFKVFEKMWSVAVCFCVIYKFSLIQNFKSDQFFKIESISILGLTSIIGDDGK